MAWQYVVFAVIALYIYTSIPKPQSAKPPGIGEVDTPTADPSRDIPVIFGTVDIYSPNCVWRGDFKSEPIRSKSGGK